MKTTPSYNYEATSDPFLFRFCDRNGDWDYYWHKGLNTFLPAVNHVLDVGFNKGKRFAEYLLSVSKEEAKKKLERAGEEGSRVHQAISDLIKGIKITAETKYLNELTGRQEVLNPDEWDELLAFQQWVEDYKPRTIENEISIHTLLYAGTYDWLGSIEITEKKKVKRVKVLIDWKTSAAIYGDYALQVAAYQHAVSDTTNGSNSSPRGNQVARKGIYTAILRLGSRHKSGYEFKLWTPQETQANYLKFLSARELFDYMEPKFEPKIEEIPLEIKVEIPKHEEIKKIKKNELHTNNKRRGCRVRNVRQSNSGRNRVLPL